jgi:hypothetical protein
VFCSASARKLSLSSFVIKGFESSTNLMLSPIG